MHPYLIEAVPAPEFELAAAFFIPCDSTSVVLQPVLNGNLTDLSYLWWNGDDAPIVTATGPGPVWLEISNGCTTIRKNAQVAWGTASGDTSLLYMPNVFNPEAGNPENAALRPSFATGITVLEYRLEVFDRWGSMVFRSQQPDEGWTGPALGKMAGPAVFVWILKAKLGYCGREIDLRKTGDVTVIR